MPVNVQDGDSFATLITDSDQDGGKLVITGRLLRDNEPAILFGRQIEAADEPLMPASRYAAGQAPDLATLERYWLNWYVTDGATSSEIQQEAGMPEEDRPLAEVGGGEPVVPDETEKPEPSAIPEVEKEEESLEPSAKPSAKPSATPTAKPTEQPQPSKVPAVKPTAAPTVAPTPMPTAAPTPAPESTQQPPAGKTIAVTMNGVPQEMDLVECLAMVARNELGPNAPAEAYKAQMVATHSWILNHGGFPSVAGRQPSESIRALAREVADQVLTYNGSVAFTPYFASAAFGTNSSQEVWGGARPYLIAVESPYDKDYASNWQNTRVYYRNEVFARGRDRLGVDLNAYSENPADWFGDLVKNSSGYVTSMRVGDKTISGKYLREKVLNDVNGKTLRSAAFDIEYDAAADAFRITTYGYGHGCGMSQMGAWGYAANGWNYADILAHYYPGTTLTQQ